MKEIFEFLKQGKLDDLTRRFDLEGVCGDVEYDVPEDVYWGLQESLTSVRFIFQIIFGKDSSFSFMYCGCKFKINKINN